MYVIKEIFYTLQGEGLLAGTPTLFCRFSKCNLWSGLEKDRHKAICQFCDTDFVGGTTYSLNDLVAKLLLMWPHKINPKVVLTGGEPLLQVDQKLVDLLKQNNFFIAIETNGTILPPKNIDHICVSPKYNSKIKLLKGNEIKVVFPQPNIKQYESLDFEHFYIQPMDGKQNSTQESIQFCLQNPMWKLSLQTHKMIGLP